MIIHPQFDPVAIHLGPLAVHWYGLMYMAGFLMFVLLGNRRIRQGRSFMTSKMLDDLLFYGVLGVVLGGRLGYVLFYKPGEYLAHPTEILRVWEGGMSFHGGFLGVLLAMILYARRHQRSFWDVADFVAPLVPLGLAAGRIGNFINGELWGRPSNVPWAMVFPNGGPLPRHPSQLYEAFLEGLVLFVMLAVLIRRRALRRPGFILGAFALGYGIARTICELFREPDIQLGFLWGGLTMGMLLSLPLMIAGLALMAVAMRRNAAGQS